MSFESNIVLAKPGDSEVVAGLVRDLLMEFFADQSHLFPLVKLKKAAAELLTPGSGVWSFMAIHENNVIGIINLNECSAIYAGGKFGEITELYIKPEFRSKKIGEKLISQAKGFAKERGWCA